MPTVGLYGGRKVGTDPFPGARLTAAETPESQGAGIAAAEGRRAAAEGAAGEERGRVLAGLGATATRIGGALYSDIVEKERAHADQVAIMEAVNKISEWKNTRLFDPDKGALNVRGKAALGLPEQVSGEFTQFAGDIATNLTTDRQKQMFAEVAGRSGQDLDLTLHRHVFEQMNAYEQGELVKLVENKRNEAIQSAADPRAVGVALNDAVDAIKTSAPRLGLGPEAVQAQVANVTSQTHVGVIEQLLATGATKQAGIYFDEAKGAIAGDQLPRLEKALKEGDTRAQSQQIADKIAAEGGSFSAQLEKARGVEDPAVRDAVEQRIEHRQAIDEKVQRDADEGALRSAFDVIDRTGDVFSIPPTAWTSFTGGERASLLTYSEKRAKGVAVDTDYPTYYSLMQTATNEPGIFGAANLLRYRSKLDDGDFKHLVELQMSIRKGDAPKAEEATHEFRTHDQVLKDSLTQYGIDPTPKDGTPEAKAIAQLRRMLDLRVEASQTPDSHGKKKPPTNAEVQATLDTLLGQQTTVPGSWWNIWPGGKAGPWGSDTKRLIDTTIDDVPAATRKAIEDGLRAKRRPVTDATVLNTFLEMQVK